VLKPQGVLLVEEPKSRFDWLEFEDGMQQAGFEILEKRRLLGEHFQSYLCQRSPINKG
jgi:hypothetical protein